MAAAACSSLCGSLATEVTSRFIRSSMLSRFRSPAVGGSTCAPANARPLPMAPTNAHASRIAALRRARVLPAPSFIRNDRQLRATDISCLLHGQRKIRSVQHPYRGLRHMHRSRRRTECDRGLKGYVVAQRAYAAARRRALDRAAHRMIRRPHHKRCFVSRTRDGYRCNCDTWPRPRYRARTLTPIGCSRLSAARAPYGGAVRDRTCGLGESRPPVACARAGPARGRSQFSVLCAAREHPSNRFRESLAQRSGGVDMCGPADVAARIFSVVPFRPSPFHAGPGARSGVGTAASVHAGVLPMACLGPAVLVRSTDRDTAPCADGAGGGAVHTAGEILAHRPRSAHSVGLLSLRDSRLALLAARRCAHLLGSAGDSRAAVPAPVPFV